VEAFSTHDANGQRLRYLKFGGIIFIVLIVLYFFAPSNRVRQYAGGSYQTFMPLCALRVADRVVC